MKIDGGPNTSRHPESSSCKPYTGTAGFSIECFAPLNWITDLFPYLGDAPERRRNHVFEHDRHDWALPIDQGVETKNLLSSALSGKGVRRRGFPSGLSSTPVRVSFKDGSRTDVDLVAGCFAVQQNPSDLALSPVIGWCVAEPPPKTPVVI
jgi:hypothetical protein